MSWLWSLMIGYLLGSILFAEIAAYLKTGTSAKALGSGNPGTANITAHLGLKSGLFVLAGDLLKTWLACFLCHAVFFPQLGRAGILYAGSGAVLGHDFSLWKKFKGGRGVSAMCATIFYFSPFWSLIAFTIGLFFFCLTKYAAVAAIVIPASFALISLLKFDKITVFISLILLLLTFLRFLPSFSKIADGTERKTDIFKKIKERFH